MIPLSPTHKARADRRRAPINATYLRRRGQVPRRTTRKARRKARFRMRAVDATRAVDDVVNGCRDAAASGIVDFWADWAFTGFEQARLAQIQRMWVAQSRRDAYLREWPVVA